MNTRLNAALAVGATLIGASAAHAQSQSLAFTGGVLLGPRISLRNLGAPPPITGPFGPATGNTVNRNYTDGYNRVDSSGNNEGDTGNWGYSSSAQIVGDRMVMSASGGGSAISLDDAGNLANPSANLEYRGSLGSVGSSAWGILISVGYESIGAQESGTFTTDSITVEDGFPLHGLRPVDLPPPGYAGTPDSKSPRIGAEPTRSLRVSPGGRILDGYWKFNADLIPISGGLYWESQLIGRLNGVAAAGVFVAFVNADLQFKEHSTISSQPTLTTEGQSSANEVIYGGFAELGLDWALWENASLVLGARWQPSQDYKLNSAGREAVVDFSSAIAIHTGFSMRF